MAEKKSKKFGRGVVKSKHYRLDKRRERNKVKRVLQSQGIAEAQSYADAKGLLSYLYGLPSYKLKVAAQAKVE